MIIIHNGKLKTKLEYPVACQIRKIATHGTDRSIIVEIKKSNEPCVVPRKQNNCPE
jgi:hypothetical protein